MKGKVGIAMKKGIAIGFAAALILGGGAYFALDRMFEPISQEPPQSSIPLSGAPQVSAPVSSVPVSSAPFVPSSSEQLPAPPEPDPFVGQPIPKNADSAEMGWLDDAVFIGDSLTYGLSAYELLPKEQVLAHTGINPQTILISSCIETESGDKTVLEALEGKNPGKIYIMLGANGVGFLSSETVVKSYGQLIDGVRDIYPDVPIYLQSILPVTAEKSSDEKYANSKINLYNEAIQALAAEKEIYYLNVAEALKDEQGNLPSDLSSDGMHFGPSTYQIWLDYLLCHRAE